jgi:hypothetical protein
MSFPARYVDFKNVLAEWKNSQLTAVDLNTLNRLSLYNF